MNNNKPTLQLVIAGVALIGATFYFLRHKEKPVLNDTPPQETLPASNAQAKPPGFNATAPTPQPTPSPAGPLPSMGPYLRSIGDCLQISNTPNDDANLSLKDLADSLRGELGDIIANNTEWKNVHILLPNGEKRRLRIEVEGTGEEGTGQRLQYFSVDKEDLPVPLPLSEEQSMNPSADFIASLENQGQVTLREEAHQGVSSKGAELYYTERNGALSEMEISYGGKSVKCQDLQTRDGNCNCF